MVNGRIALEPATTNPDKGHAIPVSGVHIRLNLKDKSGKFRLAWINQAGVTVVTARRRRILHKLVKKKLNAKVCQGAAEIDRSLGSLKKQFIIKGQLQSLQ